MDDDLATNYSIRSWFRHNRQFPVEGLSRLVESLLSILFFVSLTGALYMTLVAWAIATMFPMPDKSNPEYSGLGFEDLHILFWLCPWYVPPALSLFGWRLLRRRRLNQLSHLLHELL